LTVPSQQHKKERRKERKKERRKERKKERKKEIENITGTKPYPSECTTNQLLLSKL
jgi:hypothetical protein